MNRNEANAFRIAQGLAALSPVDNTAQRKRQAANKAARAQALRDLKSKRQGKSK
ncbi:hypothetical protein UFOVP273_128 [uncultured Caudovirales phage]|uniref:Uncharacterized protein n=1 Tax=uncultured Caudovirales phage TaxID=2100421 RepID=A0A6J5LS14_9CAUD|nr:hypothetical protein UFOVP273_128 [uncultured Caudovirales phage]